MRRIKFSGTLRYKYITQSHPVDQTVFITEKESACHSEDFAVLANHKEKIKESEKIDIYLDLAWEMKKLWNRKVKEMPISLILLNSKRDKKNWRSQG